MTHPRTGRALAAVAGVVAIALLATGCSLAQAVTGHLVGQVATPRVGDCWTVSYQQSQQSEDWEGTGSIPCERTHQSYTFAVAHLTTTFTGSWLDSHGKVRADVDGAAYAACLAAQKRLLPGITLKEGLLAPTYYLPSVAQWDSGARWVRCDLTEIKVGSSFGAPRLANLPARFAALTAALDSDPRSFALCEDDPANNGPDGAQTTYASCTGPADWTLVLATLIPGASGAPYPGAGAVKALAATECTDVYSSAAHLATPLYPTPTTWAKYGDRELDCWLDNN